ncbi:hypothetical protein LG3211_3320 [Lysobacter gummosus]|nr:hypothetical protein LG3211_3320 [Lysobacter gummosus]
MRFERCGGAALVRHNISLRYRAAICVSRRESRERFDRVASMTI